MLDISNQIAVNYANDFNTEIEQYLKHCNILTL